MENWLIVLGITACVLAFVTVHLWYYEIKPFNKEKSEADKQ